MSTGLPPVETSALPAFAAGDGGIRPIWRSLCLVEISNIAVLRRLFGRSRAEQLTVELLAQLGADAVGAHLSLFDGRTIEIAFDSDARDGADRMLGILERTLARPLVVDGERHLLHCAIGAATGRIPETDELSLLEEAEGALADARLDRRVHLRDASVGEGASTRAALSRELPGAIAGGQMRLHYQPKIHLRRQEVASVEALIRWERPDHGLVPPNEFVGIAEDIRLIDRLTLWTIGQVIDDQARLRRHGYDPTIFINVSGQLLSDARFVEQASAMVRDSRVNLGFEVTETSVIRDPKSAIANLKHFAAAGITIAIDDYGAGLSSLAYLKQLPASELKIDKLFVTQLASSNRDPLIVRSTIDLAHALEMEVVAEGVETPAALALLTVMGCDMAQGFLISRPIPLDRLIAFLDEQRFRELGGNHHPRFGALGLGTTRSAG